VEEKPQPEKQNAHATDRPTDRIAPQMVIFFLFSPFFVVASGSLCLFQKKEFFNVFSSSSSVLNFRNVGRLPGTKNKSII
jgi:hypothetical protein